MNSFSLPLFLSFSLSLCDGERRQNLLEIVRKRERERERKEREREREKKKEKEREREREREKRVEKIQIQKFSSEEKIRFPPSFPFLPLSFSLFTLSLFLFLSLFLSSSKREGREHCFFDFLNFLLMEENKT